MSEQRFTKASQQIGTQPNLFGAKETKDPAETLAPNKNFRKANEASGSLW